MMPPSFSISAFSRAGVMPFTLTTNSLDSTITLSLGGSQHPRGCPEAGSQHNSGPEGGQKPTTGAAGPCKGEPASKSAFPPGVVLTRASCHASRPAQSAFTGKAAAMCMHLMTNRIHMPRAHRHVWSSGDAIPPDLHKEAHR